MFRGFVRGLASCFSSLFFPPFCCSCSAMLARESAFCDSCWQLIKPLVSHDVVLGTRYTMKVLAASAYVDPVRSLIVRKFSKSSFGAKCLGEVMLEKTYVAHQTFDIIIPVPLHWLRFARRGFNQALVASRYVGRALNLPVKCYVRRSKRTSFQSRLSKEQRASNVHDAFTIKTCDRAELRGKRILIVDDLYTTGATLKSMALEIAQCSPASITALVAARACEK